MNLRRDVFQTVADPTRRVYFIDTSQSMTEGTIASNFDTARPTISKRQTGIDHYKWAYAGFFFVMPEAIISHITVEEGLKELFGPTILTILLILTIVSWYFRPESRFFFPLNKLNTK